MALHFRQTTYGTRARHNAPARPLAGATTDQRDKARREDSTPFSRRKLLLGALALLAGCGNQRFTLGDAAQDFEFDNRLSEAAQVHWEYDTFPGTALGDVSVPPQGLGRTTIPIVGHAIRFLAATASGKTVLDQRYMWTDIRPSEPFRIVIR
jgi:hypothetical protein